MVRINFWMIFIVILMSYSIPLYSEEKGKRKVMQWEVEKAEPLSPAFDRSKRKTNWLGLWLSFFEEALDERKRIPRAISRWKELESSATYSSPLYGDGTPMYKSKNEEKRAIVELIGKASDKRGLFIIKQALINGDKKLKLSAMRALIGFNDSLVVKEFKPILRKFLEDKDEELKVSAAVTLAFWRDTAAWDVLKEHPNPDALMALGTEESVAFLEEIRRKLPPSPIGKVKDPWCEVVMTHIAGVIYPWHEILERLKSDNFVLREIALIHLMMIDTPEAIELIKKCLNDPNPYVRQHAEEVLNFLPTWRKFVKKQKEFEGGEK